jgi:hypothetical protein
MKKPVRFLSALLLAISIMPGLLHPASFAALDEKTYGILSDILYAYKTEGIEAYDDVAASLKELKTLNPGLGEAWEKVMNCWFYVNTDLEVRYDRLPDALPGDDSLCIVVLGYQLNPDGSMAEELLARCETALNCAEQYPNAFIAVTGGGTAWQARDVTEAGRMAAWLKEHGVAEERILVEDRSQTTAQNAVFTSEILFRDYPQVKNVAIVSSDYHICLGWLLFYEQFVLSAYEKETPMISVIANAACHAETLMPYTPKTQAADVWSVAGILEE